MMGTIWVLRDGELVEKSQAQPLSGITIIPDIQPYKAVGFDVATGGAPAIGSRREHREFLKRNNYIEVGNEKQTIKPRDFGSVAPDLRRALEEVKSRR